MEGQGSSSASSHRMNIFSHLTKEFELHFEFNDHSSIIWHNSRSERRDDFLTRGTWEDCFDDASLSNVREDPLQLNLLSFAYNSKLEKTINLELKKSRKGGGNSHQG